jgi:hypothetical protein
MLILIVTVFLAVAYCGKALSCGIAERLSQDGYATLGLLGLGLIFSGIEFFAEKRKVIGIIFILIGIFAAIAGFVFGKKFLA